jgi:hypothetical protein
LFKTVSVPESPKKREFRTFDNFFLPPKKQQKGEDIPGEGKDVAEKIYDTLLQ